jgi:hypothetical protein
MIPTSTSTDAAEATAAAAISSPNIFIVKLLELSCFGSECKLAPSHKTTDMNGTGNIII